MLDIKVYKGDTVTSLELKPGTAIEMEAKSPFFDEEDNIGQYSYPIEVPGTENNRAALGSPERLDSITGERPPYWLVDVNEDTMPYLTGCKMTLLKGKGDFSYKNSEYSTSIAGPESIFGTLVKGKTLRDLRLGGTITFNETSRQFAYNHMNGNYPEYGYITFVPMWCYGFIGDNMQSSLIPNDMINNIVMNPIYPGTGWVFGAENSQGTPSTLPGVAAQGDPLYRRHRTVPFFNLHYVIKSIYQEHGYTVYGDFLDDTDYQQLFMFNNFGIELYGYSNYDGNRNIFPYLHMSKMPIADFLSKIQGLFGYKPVFREGNKVQLVYKNSLFESKKIVDLTGRAFDYYESEWPADQDNGYAFSFKFPDGDQLAEDYAKKEIDKSRVILTVGRGQQIPAGYYQNKLYKQDDLIYAEWENYYYRYNISGWDAYSEGMEPFVSNGGRKKYEHDITPLCRHIRPEFGVNGITEYMGLIQDGSYYNDNNAIIETDFDIRLFYTGSYSGISGLTFPQFNVTNKPIAYTHSTNPGNGVKWRKNSLNWCGQDGLYHTHHKRFTEARFNNTVVKVRFQLLPAEHEALDFETKIKLGSSHFLVDHKSMKIGGDRTVEALLMKI